MDLLATGYLVLMHHPEAGTFAPAFQTMDEAENFANAMRLVTDDMAISEPVPMVHTINRKGKLSSNL
jgi:hypothetical protein